MMMMMMMIVIVMIVIVYIKIYYYDNFSCMGFGIHLDLHFLVLLQLSPFEGLSRSYVISSFNTFCKFHPTWGDDPIPAMPSMGDL